MTDNGPEFEAGDGCVIHNTSLGKRERSHTWVTERLADWSQRLNELLRTPADWARMDARVIADRMRELEFVGSCVWPNPPPEKIPELRPISCEVIQLHTSRTLDRKWTYSPEDAA